MISGGGGEKTARVMVQTFAPEKTQEEGQEEGQEEEVF